MEKKFSFVCSAESCFEEEVLLKGMGDKKVKQRFIKVIVSGLKNDRQDEMMSQESIDDMILQYKSATIPFFSDHGLNSQGEAGNYTWQGIMGVWVDAVQDGNNLKATLRLNSAHPDAEQFYKYIQNKMPVGFSIAGNPVSEPKMVEIE